MTEKFSIGQLVSFSEKKGTLRYKLAPYNEKARDRDVTFTEGSIDFSNAEGAIVNLEHDAFRPIGKLSTIESKSDGLYAVVALANTTLGRDAFEEAKEGLRTGISMELSEMTPATGTIEKAILSGAGICVNPALGSARLISAFSEDQEVQEVTPSEDESEEELETTETESSEEEEETPKEESAMENSALPTASNGGSSFALNPQTIAQAYANKDTKLATTLEDSGLVGIDAAFALGTVTHTGHTGNVEQSQWLGELWSGNRYERKYANLVSSGTLTSWKVEGWKFLVKPQVGPYAGNLAEIPTNVPTTVRYSVEAERLAGGWKLDRKFRDFNNTEFIASFFAAATEDYARKSDKEVFTFLTDSANPFTPTLAAPEGVNPHAARIVDAAIDMMPEATPTFAIVGKQVYRELLLTTEFDNLKYINQTLGLEGGNFAGLILVPSDDLAPTAILLGSKNAVTFFELPGTPIRVNALDVAHGGEDEALFGYYALILNDTKGLVWVNSYTPPV